MNNFTTGLDLKAEVEKIIGGPVEDFHFFVRHETYHFLQHETDWGYKPAPDLQLIARKISTKSHIQETIIVRDDRGFVHGVKESEE